ncbi:MAG: hypothetical protein AB1391_04800 [Candidatus Micrarchaeota archaeon]
MRYLEEKAGKVHFAITNRGFRCVSSKDIVEICGLFGFSAANIRAILVRKGALIPLFFKGIFYVRNSSELLTKTLPSDRLILVALACNKHLDRNWYFGLYTALQLNNLSGVQTPTKIFIITKKQLIPRKRRTANIELIFSQIKGISFSDAIMEKNGVRYSNPVRTAMDFLHLGIKKKDTEYAEVILDAILDLDEKRFVSKYKRLLPSYSTKASIKKIIEKHLSGYHAL